MGRLICNHAIFHKLGNQFENKMYTVKYNNYNLKLYLNILNILVKSNKSRLHNYIEANVLIDHFMLEAYFKLDYLSQHILTRLYLRID